MLQAAQRFIFSVHVRGQCRTAVGTRVTVLFRSGPNNPTSCECRTVYSIDLSVSALTEREAGRERERECESARECSSLHRSLADAYTVYGVVPGDVSFGLRTLGIEKKWK